MDLAFAVIQGLPDQPRIDIGIGRPIYAWGVLVALGFLFGTWYAARRADRNGQNGILIFDYGLWVFFGGFIGAHFFHAFFYEPHKLQANWLYLFNIPDGVSSYGGFIGAAITSVLFFKIKKQRFIHYANPLALGMAPGWAIGRIGCFLAHDHPGKPSDFFLAVDFPPNNVWGYPPGPRHDLGLYDSILSWLLFGLIWWMARRNPRHGLLGGVLCLGYAIPRFFFDFLRFTDKTYMGMTPAQYMSFVLAAFGLFLIWRSQKEGRPGDEISREEPGDDQGADGGSSSEG